MPNDLKGPKFEDNIEFINAEIAKRRGLWTMNSVQWMDYDDVSQIIRIHINNKWHLYDQNKPLGPWLNRVISYQVKNIIRNIYGNYVRPCLKCAAQEGESFCKIYQTQCNDCPLYKKWKKNRELVCDVKIPLPIDDFLNNDTFSYTDQQDIEVAAKIIHDKMKKILRPLEWLVYKMLFIEGKTESETAKKMGYKTTEVSRHAGYRQICNIRKSIIEKVKKALVEDKIDIL